MPTKCSNCGNEASNDVKTCAQCGGEVGGRLHVLKMLGGIAIGLCLVSFVGQLGKSWISPTGSRDAAENAVERDDVPIFSVTAHEIATAYEANTAAAIRRFKNSRFLVTGVITAIDKDVAGGPVVVLDGGTNQVTHPQASLSASEKAEAAGLVTGTPISLICTGRSDAVKAPRMKNCVIRH